MAIGLEMALDVVIGQSLPLSEGIGMRCTWQRDAVMVERVEEWKVGVDGSGIGFGRGDDSLSVE